ncbi:MAG: hypothetical protein A3A04_01455 [Candidatus Harrisonbacteria bacterium RIFCSPLOWO2_01_FULL_40_28]|uniref:DUF11 domain-containing protein n=1 Tax=Candidatus Harrisonbacteria bacterium RIFCSPLOWO2_01_FULL_40_28 TaxID=1798406 RepID=A0A1G1ZNZ8_9BACT|nr:MAG: hypothetical protein A3A04_01455 [Candidatus Harrisonbacteria bacterium RIFCSPLOWO2_01_FULL_40_28]
MSLEDLEKKIYGTRDISRKPRFEKDLKADKEVEDSEKGATPDSWERTEHDSYDEDSFFSKLSKRFLIIASSVVGIVILVVGYFVYQFFTVKEFSFDIIAPSEIRMGSPFDMRIVAHNNSPRVLKNTTLVFEIPEGAVIVGKPVGHTRENRILNDIGAGSVVEEEFKVMFIEGVKTKKKFNTIISYNPDTFGSARFEKSKDIDVVVTESVISLDVSLPEKVLSGDVFDVGLRYRNNADTELSNLELTVQYSKEFVFKSANPSPSKLNSFWELGSLLRGSEGEIKIKGSVLGKENTFFPMDIRISTTLMGEKYTVSAKHVDISIAASPLSLDVSMRGSSDGAFVKSGDRIHVVLHYKNMTDVALGNVVVRAQLIGELYDLGTLVTSGFFSSVNNTITWNVANTPFLRVLESNDEGTVSFDVSVRNDFIPKRLGDKNFVLKVRGEVESPTVPSYISAEKTIGLGNAEIKVGGGTLIDAQGFFRDAVSGIINGGSIPPRMNEHTQYTIHWIIKNSITDVVNIRVNAFLQAGVTWTGVVKSNVGSAPIYNPETQEIIWIIDRISAGRGFVNDPLEAIFQVEVIPSLLDVGRFKPIIGNTNLEARDSFTEAQIIVGDSSITTELGDDPTVDKGKGTVVK